MANAKIPRVIDGVCVCSICCHQVWTSTYSCLSPVGWGAPVAGAKTVIAGPCPSDTNWRQVGIDACVYQYDAYHAIDDICGDCGTYDPPAAPTSGAPSGCCDTSCCRTIWTSYWDCTAEPPGWTTPVVDDTVLISGPCPSDSPWTRSATPCGAFYVGYAPGAEPCPTPAPPPAITLPEPPGCCSDTTCCEALWTNEWDCDANEWKPPVLVGTELHAGACPPDVDWAYTFGCNADGKFYTAHVGTDPCPTPPAPPANTLAEPSSCCNNCCFATWSSVWDCTSGVWGTPVLEFVVLAPGPCDGDIPWTYTTGCTAEGTFGTPHHGFTECPTPPAPPAITLPEPPGCCTGDNCCKVDWLNEWDCETHAWKTPTLLDISLVTGPCPSDVDWEYTSGCFAQATFYYPHSGPDPCPDPPPTPPVNELAEPEACCDCCQTQWGSSYRCLPTPGWTTPVLTATHAHVPCAVDSGWIISPTGCTALYIKYSSPGDCSPPPTAPPVPSTPPPCCCASQPCLGCGTGHTTVAVPNPQAPITIFGSCFVFNGVYTPGQYQWAPAIFPNPPRCRWTWTGPSGQFFQLFYNEGTGEFTWFVTFGINSASGSSFSSVFCNCGTLTGLGSIVCSPFTSGTVFFG